MDVGILNKCISAFEGYYAIMYGSPCIKDEIILWWEGADVLYFEYERLRCKILISGDKIETVEFKLR